MTRNYLIALLAIGINFFSLNSSFALDFREPAAQEMFRNGSKPVLTNLKSTFWTQVAGTALYKVSQAPWVPGPVGENEAGDFPVQNVLGKFRAQMKTELEFVNLEGSSTTSVSIRSFSTPVDSFPASSYYVPLKDTEKGVQFRITKEGDLEMAKDYPGIFGGAAAVFDCRSNGPDKLVCAATFEARVPAEAPEVLRSYIGKVFYYALYQKKAAKSQISAAASLPNQKKSKGYRCAMRWGAGGQVEIMTFTRLNRPARIGKGSMVGVGVSWVKDFPKITNRVVVLKVEEEGGSTAFYIVNAAKYGFTAEWEPSEHIKNAAGLPMVGVIKIPNGGGNSEVRYPPGWGQDEKSFAASSARAPTEASCREQEVPVPEDPYAEDAGGLL